MSDCGHGHVHKRADGVRTRCGGPGVCPECSRDFSEFGKTLPDGLDLKQRAEKMFEELSDEDKKQLSKAAEHLTVIKRKYASMLELMVGNEESSEMVFLKTIDGILAIIANLEMNQRTILEMLSREGFKIKVDGKMVNDRMDGSTEVDVKSIEYIKN